MSLEDRILIAQMHLARRICKLGHEARSKAGIKLRQPLSKVLVYLNEKEIENYYQDFIKGKTNELPKI
jgi:hypothetical protein